MKTQILKAVARPQTLFWAPMELTVINIMIQMAIIVLVIGVFPGEINSSIFIVTFAILQVGFILLGAKVPHLPALLRCRGQVGAFWNKNKIKAEMFESKPAPEGDGIVMRGRQIRVVSLRGKMSETPEWRQWLRAMARYPIQIQVWASNKTGVQIILSAEEKDSYRLREAAEDTVSILGPFGSEELGIADVARIWNDILAQKEMYLKGKGAFVSENSQKYTACIGINRWGDEADSTMTTDLLALEDAVKLEHALTILPSVKANSWLLEARKIAFFSTFSQKIYDQYTAALEAIDARSDTPEVFVDYALSIWVSAKSLSELDQVVSRVQSICERYGVVCVREKKMAKACFTQQFPGAMDGPRSFVMLSSNAVSFLSGMPETGVNLGTQF